MFRLPSGALLELDPNDYFQVMMYAGFYSEDILEILRKYVKPGDHVIDVGAHIGFMTAHMAQLTGPAGKVYSFEPDPRVRELLIKSMRANEYLDKQVTVFPYALGAEEKEITFYLTTQTGWSTAVAGHFPPEQYDEVKVSCTSLDTLLQNGSIKGEIKLIKIDAEGFEVDVIEGAKGLIRKYKPVLIMEVWDDHLKRRGYSAIHLINKIKEFGYQVTQVGKMDVLCLPNE